MTESNLITAPTSGKIKPAKPYLDFPLFPPATGRWAKKLATSITTSAHGRRWMPRWHLIRAEDALHAGRIPVEAVSAGVTVKELCNKFLNAKGAGPRHRRTVVRREEIQADRCD